MEGEGPTASIDQEPPQSALIGVIDGSTHSDAIMWGINIALGIARALIHLPIDDRPLERAEPAVAPPS